MPSQYAVGVDIGGTFTDIVAYDEMTTRLFSEKILTTPDHPADAVISGLVKLESDHAIKLDRVRRLLHATTLATNALIERKGARTGLLTTAGFEDVLDIRKGMRYNQYDLKIQFPRAYVPRSLRRGVDERVLASGEVLKEPSEDQMIEMVSQLVDQGIDSLAICFLHSYANPEHELKAREVVTKNFPRLTVSISSEITPQAREYERMSTTVADAYIKPIISKYLDELTESLEKFGFGGKILLTTCSGGVVDPSIAKRVPVLLLESGPVAGVSISSQIGKRLGLEGIFSFDMGGTTAKGSIIIRGKVEKGYEFEAARVDKFRRGSGIPISIPTVRLIEIGSGGGGVARVDDLGIVRVGPESAGAKPGPVCYDLGGTQPTVTDSNLVLGYLDPDYFLGGAIKLQSTLATTSIRANIADKLGLTVEDAAWAIHERANEDIASAFRLYASEVGADYRDYSFLSFGGAGPLHAVRIAKKLYVKKVVIPSRAGVLSAEGLLSSPLSIDLSQSKRYELSDLAYGSYKGQFEEMVERGAATLQSAGLKRDEIRITRKLDMCYHGQGYDVPVELHGPKPTEGEFRTLREMFEASYRTKYSISRLSNAVEITSFKVTVSSARSDILSTFSEQKDLDLQSRETKRSWAFDPNTMKFRNFEVLRRRSIRKDVKVHGPALIQEVESTTVVPTGCTARVDGWGNIVISVS